MVPADIVVQSHANKLSMRTRSLFQVPENNMRGGSSLGNGPTSLFLYIYTIFMDKDQYLNGITRKYRINIAPTTSSSRVVYPAECYIVEAA
jgi:hypothetical protein